MSCSLHSAKIDARLVTVSVNGVVVSRDAIAREIQQHPAASPLAAWKEAAQALVVRELMLQEARRLSLQPEPQADSKGRLETEEEALIRALIEHEVKVPEPDSDTCRRYYEQNRRRFRSHDLYEASHILISADARVVDAYRIARDKAEIVLALVLRDPSRFADFAKSHSACPSAAQGGNLGQITPGSVTPEFEKALKKLKPGTIFDGLVATHYGFHIVRLERKIDNRELPFDLVMERIVVYLSENVRRRATAQYIARLVSRAVITGVELQGAESHRVNG